jgi:membrane fusion protein, multidrug efflux system
LVSVRIQVRTDKNAIVIPSHALMRGESGQFVYVVKKDKTAETREVVTGEGLDSLVSVRSGVQAGELVVVDGQARLAAGSHVHF